VALHLQRSAVVAEYFADHAADETLIFFVCLGLGASGCARREFLEYRARRKFPVPNGGQQILLGGPDSVFRSNRPIVVRLHIFEADLVLARLFFQNFAADLDGAFALMDEQPVLDLVAGARGFY